MVKFRKTIKLSYILFIITALFSSQCQSTTLNDWGRDHPRAKVTLDYWGEACSIDMGDPVLRGGVIPYFDCQSYLYGMLDAYLSVSKFIPKNQRVCLPINISPWQILQDTKYIFDVSPTNDDFRKPYNGPNTASVEIIKELHKKYPCK